ncbi:TIGR01212 family radical SAM protein [Porphyromonas crevioricanis]|uniref:Radical SAM protein n=1 Tax=Porphyromonas crevioricanis TaxID=393921 RepID=A0AB34PES4_9PORP|nr:TIGR01212 family radical SAM protein [Porphyromonas crevioricanis]KGN93885.1 radical SAM protein [Porphyromonas crevioricanis]
MPRNSYIDFATFLSHYFPGQKVQKISVNASQKCPTRDGKLGKGGCTYCNNASFSPAYASANKSISEQLSEGIAFFSHKYPTMVYLAYFQAYTATYGEEQDLISKYEEAVHYPGVVGLVIGTRPDCMSDSLLSYLSDLSKRCFVLIEYGVESTLDKTLALIQRGHNFACSAETIHRTHQAGLLVGAHLILGLPDETREEMLSHADRLSTLPIDTLKLHQLQIIKGSLMAHDYTIHPEKYHFMTEDEYVELCVDFIQRLRPDIVLERFVSSSPPQLILAPHWGKKNYQFVELIRRKLNENRGLNN